VSGNLKRFSRLFHLLIYLTLLLVIPFMAVVYFFGVPLLSWIYNVDLSAYFTQLMLVSAGAVFFTLGPLIGMSLIIMKRQRVYMYSYIVVGAVSGPVAAVLVWMYGISGAMLSNLIVFAPLSVLLYVVFRRVLTK